VGEGKERKKNKNRGDNLAQTKPDLEKTDKNIRRRCRQNKIKKSQL
jgi:hypothetical protein